MTPFKSRSSRSSGIAVISFDFSSVLIYPKHTPSCSVSILANTRKIVSALGILFAKSRYFFNTFILSSAYKCIDSMLLYPQSSPKNTIISISTRLCFLHLSIRLSFIVSKDSFKFIRPPERILLLLLIF